MRLPFRYLEPTFFGGLFDDPLLYLKMRPTGRGILFDCGKLHHLAKRVVKSLDAVFVSHAHMDHFMGIAALTRSMHVGSRQLKLFGPLGIRNHLESHLASFDWNLAEEWWGGWRAWEVAGSQLAGAGFSGPDRFRRLPLATRDIDGGWIYDSPWVRVQAAVLDHKLPVLGFRIEESPGFRIDPQRLRAQGLSPGPWIEALRVRLRDGHPDDRLELTTGEDPTGRWQTAGELYAAICSQEPPSAIGYLTDFGMTDANLAQVRRLCRNLTLLVCECSFLRADQDQARRSYHLCSGDFNLLLDELRPRWALPMHLSKTYLECSEELYAELEPPPGTCLLQLPDYLSPRPLLADEVPFQSERVRE